MSTGPALVSPYPRILRLSGDSPSSDSFLPRPKAKSDSLASFQCSKRDRLPMSTSLLLTISVLLLALSLLLPYWGRASFGSVSLHSGLYESCIKESGNINSAISDKSSCAGIALSYLHSSHCRPLSLCRCWIAARVLSVASLCGLGLSLILFQLAMFSATYLARRIRILKLTLYLQLFSSMLLSTYTVLGGQIFTGRVNAFGAKQEDQHLSLGFAAYFAASAAALSWFNGALIWRSRRALESEADSRVGRLEVYPDNK